MSRALRRGRTADDFAAARAASARKPRGQTGPYAWSLETIRDARDDQQRGLFGRPAQLAKAFRTNDAIFVARQNRVAPQAAVRAVLQPHPSTRGKAIAKAAAHGVSLPRRVLEGIHGTLADHGLAIGYNEIVTNDDGTHVHFRLTEWPIEHVYWEEHTRRLMTKVRDALPVEIVHGDGRWTVFRKVDLEPWTHGCLLPAALVFAAHGNGIRDWAGASTSHGRSKLIGELPAGIALQELDDSGGGKLTPEAEAFLQMLVDVESGEIGAAIRPAGSKVDLVSDGSTAWQVFSELINNREKAAARIYLGTDGILGANGGAPGVDITALFGVATTIVQGDFEAIEQAINVGVLEPWAAVNYGVTTYAPRLAYDMPDPDAEKKADQRSKARKQLFDTLALMRENGMVVDQDAVNALADELGVSPAPQLAGTEERATPIDLAPTDVARVVRVREARAAQGLPPLGDPRDDLFISELEAKAEADADADAEQGAP